MYTLLLPNLCAALLTDVYQSSAQVQLCRTVLCAALYSCLCRRFVEWYFWDRSVLPSLGKALILVAKLLNKL